MQALITMIFVFVTEFPQPISLPLDLKIRKSQCRVSNQAFSAIRWTWRDRPTWQWNHTSDEETTMRHARWRSRQRSDATLQNRFQVEKNQFDVLYSVWPRSPSRRSRTHLSKGFAILGGRVGLVVLKGEQSSESRPKDKVLDNKYGISLKKELLIDLHSNSAYWLLLIFFFKKGGVPAFDWEQENREYMIIS